MNNNNDKIEKIKIDNNKIDISFKIWKNPS